MTIEKLLPAHHAVPECLAAINTLQACKVAMPQPMDILVLFNQQWAGEYGIGFYNPDVKLFVTLGGFKFIVQPTHWAPVPPQPYLKTT